MDNELKQYLEAMEERLMKGTEERITAAVTASEERLVEPIDTRVRGRSSMLRAVDADLEYFQERLKKLENRPTGT
jgi:hypothetical protein